MGDRALQSLTFPVDNDLPWCYNPRMDKKLILTDADGVILDWEYAFDIWMNYHGFHKVEGGNLRYSIGKRYGIDTEQGEKLIKIFNESPTIGFLPALRDAAFYVKKIHEELGYVFHCITSLSSNEAACKLRKLNLQKLFGNSVFEECIFLDTNAPKHEALEPYRDSGLLWIEDKIKNAEIGHEMGLRSIIMEHGHNMSFEHPEIPRVKNWKEIYEQLRGGEPSLTGVYIG